VLQLFLIVFALQAFDSLNYPHLADMGVDVQWNTRAMLNVSLAG
jgi:hypothetical protein